ncbi:MAG: tRNA (adenosine(37)-N6)-threonylcarbamoyltransferase complex dimerization subunit type 1 TsaB [Ornithinimicrobium sp.]|uniref:tRNA (adenosine(37)-N6)-threonylcarbamoyltransferase complex dimerization subunit type 1 TsaB n=1 Tax=Ornithinimicrobium sp. TaxID=1977084 RepID=UPI003D9BD692
MLLAIDTSTSLIGAAVHDGSAVLAEVTELDPRRHAELLGPGVHRCLAQAGVAPGAFTAVAVGVGPGPFTGLRVGVVTALVLGQVWGVPVHGICSLDALAAEVAASLERRAADLLVATDARRKEVYWARYAVAPGAARRTEGPGVARAADLPRAVRDLPAVGRGPHLYPDVLHAAPGPLDVRPGVLAGVAAAALAAGDPDGVLLPPEPLYLRRPDAVARAGAVP